MNEVLRENRTRLLVTINPDFMSRVQDLSTKSGVELNVVMNEILKIGEGVVKHRVEDGDNEIRIKFQEGGGVIIEGRKNGNGHKITTPTP